MIRAILLVGWLGMAVLAWTFYGGYQIADEESAQRHLTVSIFAAGALLFADAVLLVYLLGTQRMVRRTAAELAMPASWAAERLPLTRRGVALAGLAAVAIGATFAIGFPTFSGRASPAMHHALAGAGALLQVATLVVAAGVLRRGEAQLVELGRAVEAVRYTPPAAAVGAGSTPRGDSSAP